MVTYLGTEIQVTDSKTRLEKNEKKKWEYGYDPDIDTVIISKDGTLGKVYEMFGIKVGLPQAPVKAKMQNGKQSTGSQKWRRDKLPKSLNTKNWASDHIRYVRKHDKRRKQGHWCSIKGKPVYMTGTYWFFLQWVRIEEDYPNFRQIQNEYMIYWEACKADPRSYGIIYVKNRRMGASSMGIAEMLLSGIMFREKQLGLVSKTGGDSKELFNRLITAFKRLPPFFKPKTDGTSTPKTELSLREPTRKRKKGETISSETGMNTSIRWYRTTLNSMDGQRMFRGLIDEASKFPADVKFNKFWNIVKTSFVKGRVVFGKAMVVSTVNPMKHGGKEYRDVYYNSKKRNDNGRTLSGLYPIYIPAQYCLEGFFDEFGFSIVEDPLGKLKTDVGDYTHVGADTYLENTEKSLEHKPDDLNEQMRKFPRKEKDAFRDSNTDCFFNIMKLEEQSTYNLEELDEDENGNMEIIRGNFAWENGIKDTKAVWHPDPINGRFWVAKGCFPPVEYRNKKVMRSKHGIQAYAPENESLGCLGIDPYNREKTSDGRGSDGAIHLYTKFNTLGLPNNAFILEYIERPKKIELFFEDVILAMNFFSVPVLPELSSDRFSHVLIERGYRHFIKNNPFKKWRELSAEEKKVGGVNAQNTKFREEQFQALNSHIEDYIGVAREKHNRPIGEMGFMPFSRTLEQWKHADPNDRGDYDAYISSSLAILGTQSRVKIHVEESKPIKIPFKRYDNSGVISKAV